MKRIRKVKKPFYKKWWFWPIVGLVAVAVTGGLSQGGEDSADEPDRPTAVADNTSSEKADAAPEQEEAADKSESESSSSTAPDVPVDHANALIQGKRYATRLNMSKQSIYEQLVSEHGAKFSPPAAQYAIDHMNDIDWNANALAQGKRYATRMNMSKRRIYDQLTAKEGGKFTAEEGQYAIDNLTDIDWNATALAAAKQYQDRLAMSPEAIRDQLTSERGGKFTTEEAEYAIQHLND